MRLSTNIWVQSVCNMALICSLAQMAFAGGEGSGGGNGVVFLDCKVRFLDFIFPETLKGKTANSKEIEDCFYREHLHISKLGAEFPGGADGFWSPAVKALQQRTSEFPILSELISIVKQIRPLLLESRIHYNPQHQKEYLSLSLPGGLQEPLAYYSRNWLVLSRRLISQLSPEDIAGLAIHESLRHLNFSGLLEQPLTTQEIEVLTRALAEKSWPSDDVDSIYEKLRKQAKQPDLKSELQAVRLEKDRISKNLSDPSLSHDKIVRLETMQNSCETKEGELILAILDRSIGKLSNHGRYLEAVMTNTFLELLVPASGKKYDIHKLNSMDIEDFLNSVQQVHR